MPTLDLYKNRRFNIVKAGGIDYKIPSEYTVEEAERLLELKAQYDSIRKDKLEDGKEPQQLENFWINVFDQLEITFQRYQPEMTAETLRGIMTGKEALELLGFFDEYRALSNQKNSEGSDDVKKKLN